MKLLFALTIIGWFKALKILTEAAPLNQFVENSRLLWGFPHESEFVGKSFSRDQEAIIFDGPTNEKKPFRFPGEEDDIDLSGSFTPQMTFSPMSKPPLIPSSGTFANCGSFTHNSEGVIIVTSSNATILTFPNGTQILYSKCEVVQTLANAG